MIRHKYLLAPEDAKGTPTPPATPPQGTPTDPPAAPPPAAPPAAPATPPPAAPPSEPAKPAEIKLTFPEGMTVNKAITEKFSKLAGEAKLDGKVAQSIADLWVEGQKAAEQGFMEQVAEWAEQTRQDPEIGGAHFEANVAAAKKIIDRIGTPALKEVITKTGLGNHPEVIRVFSKIGKLISEDRLPGATPADASGQPTRAQLIREAYPNSPEMWGAQ